MLLRSPLFFLLLLSCSSLYAWHPSSSPQRTPEEEALKQTERIVREIGITDETVRDTLYRMHLKYARQRRQSNTRLEEVQRMNAIVEELQGILTSEQYNRFMNKQISSEPHRPQQPLGAMPQPPLRYRNKPPMHEGPGTPPPPPESQP